MTTEHKTAAELTPSREEAPCAALAFATVNYFVELTEQAGMTLVTLRAEELRAVLSYVEWLVTERKETATALAEMGGAEKEKVQRDLALSSVIDLVQTVDGCTDEEYALAFMAIRSTLEIYGLGGDA